MRIQDFISELTEFFCKTSKLFIEGGNSNLNMNIVLFSASNFNKIFSFGSLLLIVYSFVENLKQMSEVGKKYFTPA